MGWDQEDNPKLKRKDQRFVSCEERDSKEKKKFQEYEEKYGKNAVDSCCKFVKPPRPRGKFENCLEELKKFFDRMKGEDDL